MDEPRLGLLGATSLVGECLLPLLTKAGWQVTAFSRRSIEQVGGGVEWQQLGLARPRSDADGAASGDGVYGNIACWLCVAPIWVLPEYLDILEASGARRIVALSSTSRFTKGDSSDAAEQAIAHRLAKAEDHLQAWAETKGVSWVILRPTLIYGRGRDKNVCEIARFIRRFGFFPLFGAAHGLRQPVHVDDLAAACLAALDAPVAVNHAYNLCGGETLRYHEMVRRVFVTLNRRPRLVKVPLSAFRMVLAAMRLLPRYRHWSAAMAERMNRDLVFDNADAVRDLGFAPRPFHLLAADIDAERPATVARECSEDSCLKSRRS
jgi:nucleoside-diphosphate-sugar epimerase